LILFQNYYTDIIQECTEQSICRRRIPSKAESVHAYQKEQDHLGEATKASTLAQSSRILIGFDIYTSQPDSRALQHPLSRHWR